MFLSQVYRRARLLNLPFQQAVINTIRHKAKLLPSAPPILVPAAEGIEPPSPLVRVQGPTRLSMQPSEWADTTPSMLSKNISAATLNYASSSGMGVRTCQSRAGSAAGSASSCNAHDSEIKEQFAEWWAEVHPAPVKTTARMREKLAK